MLVYSSYPRPALVVGESFDALSAEEQEATLASCLVQADLAWQGLAKYAAVIVALNWALMAGLVRLDLEPAVPGSIVGLIALVVTAISSIAWVRRIIYRSDRKVADVMGWPVIARALDLDRRRRYQRRGLWGIFVGLCIPRETDRTDAVAEVARSVA